MSHFRLQVRALPREQLPPDVPPGEHLAALVRGGLARGPVATALVVVRTGAVEVLDAGAAVRSGLPLPVLLAGLTTTRTLAGPVEAVGLAGRLLARMPGASAPIPVAGVFLEWADNRWWHWQAHLDAQGRLLPHTERVRSADRGDPLPDGLGRWWSAARRRGPKLSLLSLASPGDQGVEH